MAIKTRDELKAFWNAYIKTNGVQGITGGNMNIGGVDIIDSMGMATDIGGVQWKNIWLENTTYFIDEMSRENQWTGIANKETTDHIEPQKQGLPYFLFQGELGYSSITAKQLIYGQRITAGSGYIPAYRVFTKKGHNYRVFSVRDPLGTPIFKNIWSFTASYDGWENFNIDPVITLTGTVFDLLILETEPDPTPTTWSAQWVYSTPQNPSTPGNGEVIHADTDPNTLYINNVDDGSTNRYTDLAALVAGDNITAGGQTWQILSSVDLTTYFKFSVIPTTQTILGLLTFVFETTTATPLQYGRYDDWWLTEPNVSGLFIADGDYNDIVPDDNQYGIDVIIQNAIISEDWDIVAYSQGNNSTTSTPTGYFIPYYEWQHNEDYTNLTEIYTTIVEIQPAIPFSGLYEFKFAWSWKYDSISTQAFFRGSTDNGVSWVEWSVEPHGVTDVNPFAVFVPKDLVGQVGVGLILQGKCGAGGRILTVPVSNIAVQRVK